MDEVRPHLVCVGNITIDEVVQPDGSSRTSSGGDAVYAGLAARRHLDDVTVLAPVGDDLPDEVLPPLVEAGLRLELPPRDLPTVRNVVTYAVDGSRAWDLVAGEEHIDRLSVYPADVPVDLLEADGFVVAAMSLQAQCALTPWLAAHGDARIFLDLREDYLLGHEEQLRDLVSTCDVFLPSEVEACTLAGTDDVAAAALELLARGPRTVVVKLADRGCVVSTGAGPVTHVPSAATPAVDSTGAGDAFCGAFAAVHLLTDDAVAAAEAGSAAARAAISDHGTAGLLPRRRVAGGVVGGGSR